MEYTVNVTVSIRKGFGPEWKQKVFTQFYDDVDPDYPREDVLKMAKDYVDGILTRSDDYRLYGHNWIIMDAEFA